MRYIIWDWNGTLLDDIDVCIQSMNAVLQKHNLDTLKNRSDYRSKFCFPIEEYYRNLGFDFSETPFDDLANEFIATYQPSSKKCPLVRNAERIVETIDAMGYRQIILSASNQANLENQVKDFGITEYFERILGIDDIYARSKIEIGRKWVQENAIDIDGSFVVGDTWHDFQVAKALGCKCIMYTNGHQNIEAGRFRDTFFVDDLTEIRNLI
jgi:phosphoglycolate phosphatase